MMKLDKRIIFKDHQIIDAEYINYNIDLLRQDINQSILNMANLQNRIYRYIGIYNEDYIEQLRFKVKRLENNIQAMKLLSQNNNYSAIKKLNFDDNTDILQYNAYIYKDPKNLNTFLSDNMLSINSINSSLELSKTNSTDITINKISTSLPIDSKNIVNIDDNNIDIYFCNKDANIISFDIIVNLSLASSINCIEFDTVCEFPINIIDIKYLDNISWKSLSISKNGLFSKSKINFPLIDNVEKIKITFGLPYCRATNRYIDLNGQQLLKNIANNLIKFIDLNEFKGDVTEYVYYVFHFGIKDISFYNVESLSDGIFISNNITLTEPAHFSLKTNINSDNLSTEFYIIKTDYDTSDNKLDAITLPIPSINTNAITKEVIKPINLDLFTDTIIDSNNQITINTQLYTVYKIAKICFTPDKDNSIIVYKNDTEYSNTKYYIYNSYLYFITEDPDIDNILYTITYTPYFSNKGYLTPVLNTMDAIVQECEFIYNINNVVSFDPTANGGEGAEIDPNPALNNYLKFLLPYSYDISTLSIKRYFEDIEDVDAPTLHLDNTGGNKNVFIYGRRLYIPFDSTLYPKLFNCKYIISGNLLNGGFISDTPYYYNQDGSLIVNWDYFETIYLKNYSYSIVNLMIITRKNVINESNVPFLNIQDVFLYSNTFNDLQTITV